MNKYTSFLTFRSVSIVVPVYKSEGSLPLLTERLLHVLDALDLAYEIIFINDGSPDRSWYAVEELANSCTAIRGINLMRNYGQHNALLCGIREAKCDVIVTIDDDLQNPPEEIPHMLAELDKGYDLVYGTPRHEQHGLFRDLASQITKWTLQHAMGAETARRVSAYRAFRTELRRAFAGYHGPYVSIDVLLTWGGSRFSAIPVQHHPRTIGESNYTFRKLMTHALNMMTGFSTWPLQAASIIGFGLAIFGVFVLIFVLGRYLVEGGSVPGFPFLASTIAIFSGAQLFALGIIGEYLARIHFRTMARPSYTIREYSSQEFNEGPLKR